MVEHECFHDLQPQARVGSLPRPGYLVRGTVVCHHEYGIGIRTDDGVCATADLDHITKHRVASPDDFVPVGTELSAVIRAVSLDGDVQVDIRLDQLPVYG